MDPCGLECDALTLLVLNAKGEGSTHIGRCGRSGTKCDVSKGFGTV